ncbi:MAG: ABC transporter permease [Candidatus Poribacteria bacterium]|nr:ABC transporter permease [Candidatus Poribacteria bacterium]
MDFSPKLMLDIALYGVGGLLALLAPLLIGYILFTRAGRESLRMGLTNLRLTPMRTLLTGFGIVVGVGAVVAVASMGDGAKEMVTEEIAQSGGVTLIEIYRDEWDSRGGSTLTSRTRGRRRGRYRRNRAKPIDIVDFRNLSANLTDIQGICGEDDYGRGFEFRNAGRAKGGPLIGATPDYPNVYNWSVREGRFFDQDDIDQAAKVVVLGSAVATDLYGDMNPVGLELVAQRTFSWRDDEELEAIRFTVIGVMTEKGATAANESWDERVLVPLTAFHKRVSGHDEIERMRIKANAIEDVPYVIAQVKQILSKRHDNPDAFTYWTATEEIANAERLGMILKLLMGVVAAIALVVAGIGIMNIMLVSVTERTQEIGLRKALGAKRRDVLFQFLIETSVLSLLGGAFGAAFGVGLGKGAAAALQQWILSEGTVWPSAVSTTGIVIAVSVAFVVGVVSGVYPARRAARLTPVDAIRAD